MGKLSRTKGHNFERNLAIEFQELGFPEARRHLEYQHQEATGVDLVHTGYWKVQCKRYKEYVPISKITEVQCDRERGEIPLLITKGDHKEPMCVLPWSDMKKIIKLLQE